MNFERAQEIFNSPNNISVLYNKESIWIENLNPTKSTALINTDAGKVNVPIEALMEE